MSEVEQRCDGQGAKWEEVGPGQGVKVEVPRRTCGQSAAQQARAVSCQAESQPEATRNVSRSTTRPLVVEPHVLRKSREHIRRLSTGL